MVIVNICCLCLIKDYGIVVKYNRKYCILMKIRIFKRVRSKIGFFWWIN